MLAGIRMLPTYVGFSPFVLLYKQHPRWPLGEASQIGGDIMDLPEDVTADEWWE